MFKEYFPLNATKDKIKNAPVHIFLTVFEQLCKLTEAKK